MTAIGRDGERLDMPLTREISSRFCYLVLYDGTESPCASHPKKLSGPVFIVNRARVEFDATGKGSWPLVIRWLERTEAGSTEVCLLRYRRRRIYYAGLYWMRYRIWHADEVLSHTLMDNVQRFDLQKAIWPTTPRKKPVKKRETQSIRRVLQIRGKQCPK